MTKDEALEVPLIELLKNVPKTARLIVDNLDGISSTSHPVGNLCHQAAEALEQPAWQGLTDDEIGRLAVFDGLHHVEIPLLAKFILAIEQALKDKNT
jgi:hypothetical protein